jgi:ElaB/YqjD/DUF883 family membrane-anchored ribosome-binding protein
MHTNDSISQSHLARQRVTDDLRRLVQDAESLITAARHDGSSNVAAIRERLEASVSEARQQISEHQHAILERARHSAQRTSEYVHVHPWTSMSAAAGAGLLIGLLLARR